MDVQGRPEGSEHGSAVAAACATSGSHLEAPEGPKRGGDPGHVATVLGEGGGQLGGDQRLGQRPNDGQQDEAGYHQQRPGGAHRVLETEETGEGRQSKAAGEDGQTTAGAGGSRWMIGMWIQRSIGTGRRQTGAPARP